MAGLASVVFTICYWLIDVQGYRRWTRPFAIYGMNAIAVFILTGFIGRMLGLIKIGSASLGTWIYTTLFAPLGSPVNTSLYYAIANVIFFYLLAYGLYRKGWFLRF